jgi:hypothetical protein
MTCQYAYKKHGDVSVHCTLLKPFASDYCAYQYLCNQTRRWEVSKRSNECSVRRKYGKESDYGRSNHNP